MKRYSLVPILLVALAFQPSCANLRPTVTSPALTPQQSFYQSYMTVLSASNLVYEETLRAVGRAKARGLVTEYQEQQWIAAGRVAQYSIEAARDALLTYVTVTSTDLPAQARVLDAVSAMNAAIANLTRIIHDLGKLAETDDRLMAERAK